MLFLIGAQFTNKYKSLPIISRTPDSNVQPMINAIETSKLTKSFNSLTAVDELDIAVESGEVFGLLGPNGARKTTTISMLCTILKPTSGTARVNGFDIVNDATQVRKTTGIA